MSNLDERIIEAFKQGRVKGLVEPGVKPECLMTGISHIFLFPKTVYKLYRKDNDSFNKNSLDLSDDDIRQHFYENDFSFNNYFSKEIYNALLSIYVNGEHVELKPKDEPGYDLVIQMSRVDEKKNLTHLLRQKALNEDELRSIGYKMTKLVAEYPQKPKTSKNYYEVLASFIDGVRHFGSMAAPLISLDDSEKVCPALSDYRETIKGKLTKITEKDFIFTIDNHSDKAFYINKELLFIYVYLPKIEWGIVEPSYVITRLYTDTLVFAGEKYSEALLQGYKDYYGIIDVDRELLEFYLIFNAFLRAGYIFTSYRDSGLLEKKEEAEAHWELLRRKIPNLSIIK
ncbi:MAG: hypothetical protein NTW60_03790 [Candidatus Wolfebacteria bacterium]|nr:hypothetical protein [Candidatus Wolfebacteria bacterium]